ncbi:MAG: hypothetical protein MZW92_13775 [Comamonadaceae bacterium]|nr:hypothetical protein [Comamonadaceae bacterium]
MTSADGSRQETYFYEGAKIHVRGSRLPRLRPPYGHARATRVRSASRSTCRTRPCVRRHRRTARVSRCSSVPAPRLSRTDLRLEPPHLWQRLRGAQLRLSLEHHARCATNSTA